MVTQAEQYVEPCNVCEICVDFNQNRAVDLIEIDAASNRGIDEARHLRENIRVLPMRARRKVYIIDEAQMLTKEAFNALLKIIEEPPAHAVFVFATTEIQKIPATILSRCQRFDFARLPFDQIVNRLRSIVDLEGAVIDDASLALLSRSSEGSLRDAESLLDQVLSTGISEIAYDQLISTLGFVPFDALMNLLQALLEKNAKRAFDVLHGIFEQGADPQYFLREMLSLLRDAALLAVDPDIASHLSKHRGEHYIGEIKKMVSGYSPESLYTLLDIFLASSVKMRSSPFAELPLELAIMEATAAAEQRKP